ncbi:DUF4391 domain-containing protein [Micrococcus luteus]|nr:DUF4391 domain-containing protein [Micrococcus luteus]MCV7742485.1 DUF4391 domain-containing protein [Micrococcus luteus]
MPDLLYAWPGPARFDRRIPKDQIYAHTAVTASVKAAFVEHVDRLVWAYKLAPSTLGIRSTEAVPEIQVIRVHAKADDVPDAVLAAVDRAIPLPVVFEIVRPGAERELIRMRAAYRPVGVRSAPAYVGGGWLRADVERTPLPAAVDLTQLYGALLSPMLGVRVDPGDTPQEVAERLERQGVLEREHRALTWRYRNEKQFNRRVKIRAEIKSLEKEMETLT